jgi:Tol biopolymer transport system component
VAAALGACAAVAAGLVASAPAWSGTIFHTCAAGARTNICAVADTGEGPVRRVTKDGRSHSPTVSRDGRRIAFQRGAGVVVATAKGGVLRTINQQASPSVIRPVISPNGRRVAWTEVAISRFPVTEAIPYICVARAVGSTVPVCDTAFSAHVGWTAAGRLVGAADPAAAVMCPLDTAPRSGDESFYDSCVGAGVLGVTPPAWPGLRPAFSRDGRLAADGLSPDSASADAAIAVFDAVTGAQVAALTAGPRDTDPVFSPDGQRIAFTRGRAIFTIPVAGGAPRRIVARGEHPAWAP